MSRPTSFPWIDHRTDDANLARVGGIILPFKAGQTLVVGDVVYYSATDTVLKSATSALYVAFVGVVVGGFRTFGEVFDDRYNMTNSAGVVQAAQLNEEVLVQISGIAKVLTSAAVALGAALQVVTTAGQVDDPAATAGQIVGTALDAAGGASTVIRMLIDHR